MRSFIPGGSFSLLAQITLITLTIMTTKEPHMATKKKKPTKNKAGIGLKIPTRTKRPNHAKKKKL